MKKRRYTVNINALNKCSIGIWKDYNVKQTLEKTLTANLITPGENFLQGKADFIKRHYAGGIHTISKKY